MVKLDEQVQEILNRLDEIARLDGSIVVRNDGDDSKFPHFHRKSVHFLLTPECPKTTTDLKDRVYFEKEVKLLTSKDFKELLKTLQGKSNIRAGKVFPTVYDYVLAIWETLNEREVI